MEKKVVYQKPMLYTLDDNNASGFCDTGSAASGGDETLKTNCVDGTLANSSDVSCSFGSYNSSSSYFSCFANGASVAHGGSTACQTGNGV